MKVSVLGTGVVGQTLSGKLTDLGHQVFMGSRDAKTTVDRTDVNPMSGLSFSQWHQKYSTVNVLDYKDLPSDSDLFINAVNGFGTMEALSMTGKEKLKEKVLLDISNPLDFSKGMPPTLFVCNVDSLAEQIQSEFKTTQVVKSLNTMNCRIMVDPSLVPGKHHVFLSGNSDAAKKVVRSLLGEMGWKDEMILDLGDITSARGTEMILPLWLRIRGTLGTGEFNFHIAGN